MIKWSVIPVLPLLISFRFLCPPSREIKVELTDFRVCVASFEIKASAEDQSSENSSKALNLFSADKVCVVREDESLPIVDTGELDVNNMYAGISEIHLLSTILPQCRATVLSYTRVAHKARTRSISASNLRIFDSRQ